MATGQSILNLMEVLDPELQLQPGESDVTKALVALNAAQDYFESLAALRGKILGSSSGTLSTANGTETTTFPSEVLRLDRLQALNANGRVDYDLVPNHRAGSPTVGSWPVYQIAVTSNGRPRTYSTNGTVIRWSPIPDATYSIRWEGFAEASDITASGTFGYKSFVMLPLATFACKLIKSGLDDSPEALNGLAQQTFGPVLDALALYHRDGPVGFEYSRPHTE